MLQTVNAGTWKLGPFKAVQEVKRCGAIILALLVKAHMQCGGHCATVAAVSAMTPCLLSFTNAASCAHAACMTVVHVVTAAGGTLYGCCFDAPIC